MIDFIGLLIVYTREYRVDDAEVRNLPLVIRERDVEYQFHRMLLFHRLLKVKYCCMFCSMVSINNFLDSALPLVIPSMCS